MRVFVWVVGALIGPDRTSWLVGTNTRHTVRSRVSSFIGHQSINQWSFQWCGINKVVSGVISFIGQ